MTLRHVSGTSLVAILLFATASWASTPEQLLFTAQNGGFPDPPYDRSDPAMIILTAMNGRCGKSKDRGTYRARVLLRETEQLVKAAKAGDDARAGTAAAQLSKSINSSKMFKSCWKTILKNESIEIRGVPVGEFP